MELTNDQQVINNLIEAGLENVFVGGEPGTGKSVLTRHLLSKGQKTYTITAPTGLAALNAMGKTLHSVFGIPVFEGIIPLDYNEVPKNQNVINHIRYGVKYWIVDEVSMVRADLFDYINRVLKLVKGNDRPFGGVQVILIGDFYQLPPVATPWIKKELREAGYESEFAFDSFAWQEGNFRICELTEVLRQKDDKPFMKILKAARDGKLTDTQIRTLNKQIGKTDGLRISLVATNKEADTINIMKLNAIKEKPVGFNGIAYGEWKAFPVDVNLQLKVGAQVMVKKNGADRPPGERGERESVVVNGTLGIVTAIEKGRKDHVWIDEGLPSAKELPPVPEFVTIKMDSGNEVKIYRTRWEKKVREFKKESNMWEERLVASYEQMPLALAWCISMHKSQGQTFDKVHIDPLKVFTDGQLYVAISRARTLKGISFERAVKHSMFTTHSRVREFFKQNKSILK